MAVAGGRTDEIAFEHERHKESGTGEGREKIRARPGSVCGLLPSYGARGQK
jgi:hypothetical protein